MKKELLLAASVAMFSALNAATIDKVVIRQQWPWSTDVKVEYRIAGVSDPVDITVEAYDGDKPLDSAKLASSMKGDLFGIAKDNFYSFTIDPVKAFGKSDIAVMNFNVRLSVTPSAANMTDVLYKIVDLNSGAVTDVRRADFYGGKYGSFETSYSAIKDGFSTGLQDVLIWTDVTNNPIYKTDFLVLRHIPASSWGPWTMGAKREDDGGSSKPSSLASGEKLIKLTQDFYIGVFPVTQAQCKKIWGTSGVYYIDETIYGDCSYKPATGLQWWKVRSLSTRADSKTQSPESDSFCGKLSAKTNSKLSFDLPTEAQWEFAARGGMMDSVLYSGAMWQGSSIHELAWNSQNILTTQTDISSGNAGYDSVQTVSVGRKYPNAFGLYDTLGNVREFCRDYSNDAPYATNGNEGEPELNPMGIDCNEAASGTGSSSSYKKHIARGGTYEQDRLYSTLRSRFSLHENEQNGDLGFRVICTVNQD